MTGIARAGSLPLVVLVWLLIVGIGAGARSPVRSASEADCRASQLDVTLGPYVSEATEQHTLALRLINRGKQACVVQGYPRVTLYDGHGAIPFRIRHGGDQMISARPPKLVRVRPGGSAFVLLNKNACVDGSLRPATRLEIAPRGTPSGRPASLAFTRTMPFPFRVPDLCTSADDPGSVITVSPFTSTVRGALHR